MLQECSLLWCIKSKLQQTAGPGEEVKNSLERYQASLPVVEETSSSLWKDSRAASFTNPHYQPYFTCKQTKEKLRQLLTYYINAYILCIQHCWVKIKMSLQLQRDAVLADSLGKQRLTVTKFEQNSGKGTGTFLPIGAGQQNSASVTGTSFLSSSALTLNTRCGLSSRQLILNMHFFCCIPL